MHPTFKNSFSKSQRLKSRKKLEAVFGKGSRLFAGTVKLLYIIEPDAAPLVKCGVGVSSRYFKKAVDRNRIRRQLREAYRLQQQPLQEQAQKMQKSISLFILYTGKTLPIYNELYKQIGKALEKLSGPKA